MFENGYAYRLVDNKANPDPHVHRRWVYTFRSDRRLYMCLVELYNENIYVIKYHATQHKSSPNKYRIILNDEKPTRIMRTCINIMLDIYRSVPDASFGFIASHSLDKKGVEEEVRNNQRFRIYQQLMINTMDPEVFIHRRNKKYSAYLLINKNRAPKLRITQVERRFAEIYPNLEF
jgi:hypothetical protein